MSYQVGDGTNAITLNSDDGRVGIGTTQPAYTVDITGVSPTFNLAAGAGQPYFQMIYADPTSANFEMTGDNCALDLYAFGSTFDATWFSGAITAANTVLLAAYSGPLILSAESGLYLGTRRDTDTTGYPAELALKTGRVDMTASVHIDGSLNNRYPVVNMTSDSSLMAGQSNGMFTNADATAAIDYVLPAGPAGVHYSFAVMTDSSDLKVTVQPGQVIRVGSSVSTAGGYIDSSAVGSALQLALMDATNWLAQSLVGTWNLLV